jgi:hypothetical protein
MLGASSRRHGLAFADTARQTTLGLRKQTPEPVFGIIKSVMGFRQFLLRGLDCVRGEWSLVTMAWNIKRMHALSLRLSAKAEFNTLRERLIKIGAPTSCPEGELFRTIALGLAPSG